MEDTKINNDYLKEVQEEKYIQLVDELIKNNFVKDQLFLIKALSKEKVESEFVLKWLNYFDPFKKESSTENDVKILIINDILTMLKDRELMKNNYYMLTTYNTLDSTLRIKNCCQKETYENFQEKIKNEIHKYVVTSITDSVSKKKALKAVNRLIRNKRLTEYEKKEFLLTIRKFLKEI